MAATLKVTHRAIGVEVHRGTSHVVLDGGHPGSLELNDTFETPVEPGRLTLQIRNGLNSSRAKTFDATEDEIVAFRCRGKSIFPIFLSSFVFPSLAISLERERRAPDQSATGRPGGAGEESRSPQDEPPPAEPRPSAAGAYRTVPGAGTDLTDTSALLLAAHSWGRFRVDRPRRGLARPGRQRPYRRVLRLLREVRAAGSPVHRPRRVGRRGQDHGSTGSTTVNPPQPRPGRPPRRARPYHPAGQQRRPAAAQELIAPARHSSNRSADSSTTWSPLGSSGLLLHHSPEERRRSQLARRVLPRPSSPTRGRERRPRLKVAARQGCRRTRARLGGIVPNSRLSSAASRATTVARPEPLRQRLQRRQYVRRVIGRAQPARSAGHQTANPLGGV